MPASAAHRSADTLAREFHTVMPMWESVVGAAAPPPPSTSSTKAGSPARAPAAEKWSVGTSRVRCRATPTSATPGGTRTVAPRA